jgi:hypothetical protein
MIESNATTLGGYPAHRVVFLIVDNNGLPKIQSMLVATIKDNKLYLINYSALPAEFSIYIPIVQQMIKTFNIANSTTTVG